MIALAESFAAMAYLYFDAINAAMSPREQKMTDEELLVWLAHHVQPDGEQNDCTQGIVVIKNEIVRRLLENPSGHPTLKPYEKAIGSLDKALQNNGYSLKRVFEPLTRPVYENSTNPPQRAFEKK